MQPHHFHQEANLQKIHDQEANDEEDCDQEVHEP